ncbi:MAG: FAD-dependent oxidoreductase [Candidatus Aminicenantales bacterium]
MPAYPWEIQEAEEEGIAIHDGWGPLRFIQKEGRVCGLELQRCTSVFDENGNFRPQYDPEERMSVEADSVILAVGQKPDVSYLPPELGLEVREDDTLGVDPETMATCVPGIFAGGEAVHGPGSAVEAMASGRRAAAAIDRYLGGTGEIDRPSGVEPRKSLWMGREEGFGARGRVPPARIPAVERMRSFGLISLGYNRDEARRESERCLRCDIRLEIPPAVLPPEKWIPLTPDALARVPEIEGAFTLLDEGKKTLYIAGVPNLRQALEEQMSLQPEARFFTYEEDPMYTKRESELIQQHLQKHGRLPPGNEDMEDLF